MHFGRIRKPRTYSNKAPSQERLAAAGRFGCRRGRRHQLQLLQRGHEQVAHGHAHFIKDGIDFWWNDEGDTSWYTYLLWNQAQADQYTQNTRHFTINRRTRPFRYQPQNAPEKRHFPAITCTGDGQQSCTHEELLRGMLNGAPLTSCACRARRAFRGSGRPRRRPSSRSAWRNTHSGRRQGDLRPLRDGRV